MAAKTVIKVNTTQKQLEEKNALYEEKVKEHHQALDEIQTKYQEATAKHDARVAEIDLAHKKERDTIQQQLQAKHDELEKSTAALKDSAAKLDQAEGWHAETGTELANTRTLAGEIQADLGKVRAQYREANNEIDSLRQQIKSVNAESDRSREQLKQTREELDRARALLTQPRIEINGEVSWVRLQLFLLLDVVVAIATLFVQIPFSLSHNVCPDLRSRRSGL